MKVLTNEYWALWFACLLLLVSCLINLRNRKMAVPNWLTVPAMVAGWIVSLTLVNTSLLPSAGGGAPSSFVATMVSLLSLVPLYATGGLGGGSVKMQMGFGAWVGCALPPDKAGLLSGVAAVVCTAIIWLLAILLAPATAQDPPVKEIIRRHQLVPSQPVFALGSIGSVFALSFMGLL
jgi:Flp pilus assembly protein protease CpaA